MSKKSSTMRMLMRPALKLAAALLVACTGAAFAAQPGPECVAPSKPGGGFDLTCKLAQQGMRLVPAARQQDALRISFMPGGIGAVAWNTFTTQRRAEPDTLVVFSSGSLLNIALRKFGNASPDDVRWLAAVGADYGMIAVGEDSPYRTLRELVDALKRDPAKLTIGAGGTIGSQDWLKMALLAKQANIDPKTLRFVAFEGGGEAFTALSAGYVQVLSGDASEATLHATKGRIRVLAVLSDARLPGSLANVPTAREQGFDVTWPVIRGFYMGRRVADADYRRWSEAFAQMMATPEFDRLRAAHGLYPFAMTGAALTEYINKTVDHYGRQAKELGLIK